MTPKQFDTLLRIRRHRRDQVRTVLGRMLAEASQTAGRLRQAEVDREDALSEIRAGTAGGGIDVDRMASLRYHSLRLAVEVSRLSHASAEAADRVRRARALLVRADQGVKIVERLRERHDAALRLEAEKRADRDATDRFSAARYAGTGSETAG